jgi:alpha-L-fucosidase
MKTILLSFASPILFVAWSLTASAQTLTRAECEANIERELAKMAEGVAAGPYKADWDSLKEHQEAPDWFRDAKIGIYFHWGVYSVPAYGNEWYAQRMHLKTGKSYYQHHVETYGEPDQFPYHNFIPMFKAQKFDAKEWADLFVRAGAKFAGPVCEHHDGYSMWASKLTPWNAGDTGPKRDIAGELEKAIRARGLKFVTTFHHERTRTWYPRVEGWPTTTSDPQLQLLYMNIDETLFNKIFQAKLGEVIDRYQPDLILFDGQMQLIPEPYHLQFLAYYFNQAKRWGRDVMVTTKKLQYPQEVSVLDFEKGRANALTRYPWLNDDTISTGSWCYTSDLEIKPAIQVLHDFIDAVSKNGHLLLNISPMADGTTPQNQQDCLLAIGA